MAELIEKSLLKLHRNYSKDEQVQLVIQENTEVKNQMAVLMENFKTLRQMYQELEQEVKDLREIAAGKGVTQKTYNKLKKQYDHVQGLYNDAIRDKNREDEQNIRAMIQSLTL